MNYTSIKKIRKYIFLAIIQLIYGCSEDTIFKHDDLYGNVTISGKVIDIVSGAPIPNAVVRLYQFDWQNTGFGYGSVPTGIEASNTTDAEGNYYFSLEAKGEYKFQLWAFPSDSLHVDSGFSVGIEELITTVGYHTLDIPCHRSAWAKIFVVNAVPIDTPYFISLSGNLPESIVLNNFYSDTVVYLKVVGRPEYPNQLRFNKDNILDLHFDVIFYPWDTVELEFNY